MTTPVKLISKLGAAGIKLWLDEEKQLRFKAPKGALTPELKEELIQHKADVIAFLAEATAQDTSPAIEAIKRNEGEHYPLSLSQQRFHFLEKLDPGNPSFHIPAVIMLSGAVKLDDIRTALDITLQQHETFNTGIAIDSTDQPYQYLLSTRPQLTVTDLREENLNVQAMREKAIQLSEKDTLKPFFSAGCCNTPLARFELVQFSDTQAALIITLHHIIADGWSINVLLQNFCQAYLDISTHTANTLAKLEIQYIDYVQWQKSQEHSDKLNKQLSYWKDQLDNVPFLELPLDAERPSQSSWHGKSISVALDASLSERLKNVASANQISLFNLLFSAYFVVLYRYTGQKDLCIGTPVAGRNNKQLEQIIGCFINLLSIRKTVQLDHSFIDFAKDVQTTVLNAQENQDIPFELVAEACTQERSLAHTPIFQCLFTHQQNPLQKLQLGELNLELLDLPSLSSKYEMQCHFNENEETMDLVIEYSSDLFNETKIQGFADSLITLLQNISTQTNLAVKDIQLQQQSSDHTAQAIEDYPSFPTLFAKTANQHPDNIAIQQGHNAITYKELNKRSNQVANALIEQELGAGDYIGVLLKPGIDALTSIIGIIKAGAAYVPMDKNYPDERLKHMASTLNMRYLLTDNVEQGTHYAETALALDSLLDSASSEDVNSQIDENSALYVIFTSGSTGLPKAAAVSHRNEANLINWYSKNFGFTEQDSFLIISSIGFDLTQKNLLTPLTMGASVHFTETADYEPESILHYIKDNNATVINCAPSAFYPLCQNTHNLDKLASLKHVLLGGEPIQLEKFHPWLHSGHCHIALSNMYGPTECTDITTNYTLNNKELEQAITNGLSMPIGSTINGVNAFILNEDLLPCPDGVPGELYIGGASLGLGYINDEEKTASAFIHSPLDGQRLYKTNDLVVQQGNIITFCGRNDDQVKLRGHRIELGEIRHKLNMHKQIKDSLICLKAHPENQEDILACYFIAENDAALDNTQLKEFLKHRLPDYMIPTAYLPVDNWPLSPNGKVDKNALPAITHESLIKTVYVAPSTHDELHLAKLFSDILGIEEIGIHDNFFDLGGHSLLATKLVSAINQDFTASLSLKSIFEYPSISELTALIEKGISLDDSNPIPDLSSIERPDSIPLSFSQERLWIIEQLNPGNSAYNIPIALQIDTHIDAEVFSEIVSAGLTALVERHEALRTYFATDSNGSAMQVIASADTFSVAITDLRDDNKLDTSIRQAVEDNAQTVFSLNEPLLFKAEILISKNNQIILLACMHHIISDGWSLSVIQKDLFDFIDAKLNNEAQVLTPSTQYADFSVWQRTHYQNDLLEPDIAFWESALKDLPPVLHLPTDKPRPQEQTFNGSMYRHTLDSNVLSAVENLSNKLGTTSFNTLLSAYALTLQQYTQQDDFCIGTPVSGRDDAQLHHSVGYYVNAVVIRNQLQSNMSIKSLISSTSQSAFEAFEHQSVPIEKILERLTIERNLAYPPIAQVGFSYIGKELIQDTSISGCKITTLENETVLAKYDLTLIAAENNGQLALHFEYNTDLFEAATIEKFCEHFTAILQQCVSTPEALINDIDLIKGDEIYAALAVDPNEIEAVYPLTAMQHDMAMSQLINPESLANTLGYRAELNYCVDSALWQKAIGIVANAQEITRTHFHLNTKPYGDRVYQCVYNNFTPQLHIQDHSNETLDADAIQKLADDFIYQPQCYEKNQFIRYGLIKLAHDKTMLLLSSHHALLDGVAIVWIAQATARVYEALVNGSELPDLNISLPNAFPTYIEQDRRITNSAEAMSFWKQELAKTTPLHFQITDEDIIDDQCSLPKQHVQVDHFTADDWQALKQFARSKRLTAAHIIKVVYAYLISEYCQADEPFYFSEFHAGRDKTNGLALGCYFTQSPFIVDPANFRQHTIDKAFDELKAYRKKIKAFDHLSLGATRQLAPDSHLNFMFNYYHFFPTEQKMAGHKITCIETPPFIENTVQFVAKEQENTLQLDLYYQDNSFQSRLFLQRMISICKQLCEGVESFGKMNLTLTDDEQSSSSNTDQNHKETLLSRFATQLHNHPEAIAVKDSNNTLSYLVLDQLSNRVSNTLCAQGVKKGDIVGINFNRSCEAIIAILATIKAGAAYAPIDPDYPQARIDHMVNSADIKLVLTHPDNNTTFTTATLSFSIENVEAISNNTEFEQKAATDEETLLYVIFTSGSTGLPKGAKVTHKGENNLLSWYIPEYHFDTSSKTLIISSLSFDLTQKNLLAPLASGGELHLLNMSHYDSSLVSAYIAEHHITHINCAPSAFYPLVEDHGEALNKLDSLQHLMFGGEAIQWKRLEKWVQSPHYKARIDNHYGPTECTDISLYHTIDSTSDNTVIPLGKPNPGITVSIRNEQLQMLPKGLVGEICVAGESVGQGYIGSNEDLNAAFVEFDEGKLYRTGDLAYIDNNDNFVFLRRKDFQLKIRGRRIEAGEIEYQLKLESDIEDALVTADNDMLVAYVLCQQEASIDTLAIQETLKANVAAHLVPEIIVPLNQWPLTPNGKIDRKALPKPEAYIRQVEYVAPRDETEEKICAIVQTILGVSKVGINDNFFDLGGHSLAASRAIVQIREQFEVDIPLNILFDMTTPEKLATYIKASQWATQSQDEVIEDESRDTGFI